jgi:hypothetical protein
MAPYLMGQLTIIAGCFIQAHMSGYGFERGYRLFPRRRWPVLHALHKILESLFHTGNYSKLYLPYSPPLLVWIGVCGPLRRDILNSTYEF